MLGHSCGLVLVGGLIHKMPVQLMSLQVGCSLCPAAAADQCVVTVGTGCLADAECCFRGGSGGHSIRKLAGSHNPDVTSGKHPSLHR